MKEPPFKRVRLSKKTEVPDGSVPAWNVDTRKCETLFETSAEALRSDESYIGYKRSKLKLSPVAGNVSKCKPVLPDASVGIFIKPFYQ